MQILSTTGWDDYELLDSGNGKRLEKYGQYILSRPDPQAIWRPNLSQGFWDKADAAYQDESWKKAESFPHRWKLTYKNLSFWAKLTPFKHTGIFPEQSLQWDFIESILQNTTETHVLNLFGYTGIASLVAASTGAKVTHVDASKPAISWTKENQELSGLSDKSIRWILDDALKFVGREKKRGVTYDGIIMDPPAYGHGPNGEKWDFHQHFPKLLSLCKDVLSPKPLFVMVNAYAISSSALMLKNVMEDILPTGTIEYGELALQEKSRNRLLSTGIFARWSATI